MSRPQHRQNARVAQLTLLLLAGCGASNSSSRSELEELQARNDAHRADIDGLALDVDRLDASWGDLARTYDTAAARYRDAESRFREARDLYGEASAAAMEAAEVFETARTYWVITGRLVQVAALIDARALDAYRAWRQPGDTSQTEFSCDPVSTAQFRRTLVAMGVSLAGLDVDHIVPRSLGGADHPSNYQLLDSSTNRALGNRWDADKCLAVGDQCPDAVAVSRRCGSYRGGMPW